LSLGDGAYATHKVYLTHLSSDAAFVWEKSHSLVVWVLEPPCFKFLFRSTENVCSPHLPVLSFGKSFPHFKNKWTTSEWFFGPTEWSNLLGPGHKLRELNWGGKWHDITLKVTKMGSKLRWQLHGIMLKGITIGSNHKMELVIQKFKLGSKVAPFPWFSHCFLRHMKC